MIVVFEILGAILFMFIFFFGLNKLMSSIDQARETKIRMLELEEQNRKLIEKYGEE